MEGQILITKSQWLLSKKNDAQRIFKVQDEHLKVHSHELTGKLFSKVTQLTMLP